MECPRCTAKMEFTPYYEEYHGRTYIVDTALKCPTCGYVTADEPEPEEEK